MTRESGAISGRSPLSVFCLRRLFGYLNRHRLELLPTCAVGNSKHEMVVAGIYILGDNDVLANLKLALPCRNVMTFVEHPGLHCLLVLVIMLMFLTFHRACAVRMMVGIAVNLDVVGPQLLVALSVRI